MHARQPRPSTAALARRGVTLVELVTALTVFAIISLASFWLVYGAMNTNRYLSAAMTTESEIELAVRRITYNLRTASSLTAPTTTAASSTLTLKTQPDPSNLAHSPYTVGYRLVGTNLVENDTRYSPTYTAGDTAADNTVCTNVSAFTVQLQSTTASPKVVTVTITTAAPQAVTRSFRVACRNL